MPKACAFTHARLAIVPADVYPKRGTRRNERFFNRTNGAHYEVGYDSMGENTKSWIVSVGAVVLGILVMAGLAGRSMFGHYGDGTPESQASSQSVVKEEPSAVPENSQPEIPALDFFGKPLDAFAREVVDRAGMAGQVVMTGKPVPGAAVVTRCVSRKMAYDATDYTGVAAEAPGGQQCTTVTDSSGKFAFYGLESGHYGLEAHTATACGVSNMPVRENSIPGRISGKTVYYAERSQIVIELHPSAPLSGRAQTKDGQPIPSATVYPCAFKYPTGRVILDPVPQVMLSVTADKDGAFRFPQLPEGSWQLAFRAAGRPDQKTGWLTTEASATGTRQSAAPVPAPPPGQSPDKTTFKLSDYGGKYLLLDFWAAWCAPYRKESANIKAVYEEFKDNPRFALVGMNLDPNPEDAKKYMAENGMGWTQVYLRDWSKSPVASQYGVEAVPYLLLLDPEGKEVARALTGQSVRETVVKALTNAAQTEEQELRRAEAVPVRTFRGGEFVWIPAGEFRMGSPLPPSIIKKNYGGAENFFKDATPVHGVKLAKGFWIGRYEVTNQEFEAFATATGYKTDAEKRGSGFGRILTKDNRAKFGTVTDLAWRNPGWRTDPKGPVVVVSWDDAQAYIAWLSLNAGEQYRLPSEAEWEYACRGRTRTEFFWGDIADSGREYLNAGDLGPSPEGKDWPEPFNFTDGFYFPAPVGQFKPNPFGLYDMLGNVNEWCQDCYHKNYQGAPADGTAWEIPAGKNRVIRGGAWLNAPGHCRSAGRCYGDPNIGAVTIGFRLVCVQKPDKTPLSAAGR